MKRFLFFTLFFISFNLIVSAQDIFNTVLNDAKQVINDTTSNVFKARIAKFKYNALQYIKRKSFESEGDVTKKFLDDQAYYMTEFVSLFFESTLLNTQLTKNAKKDRIMMFIDASGSNPLFHDNDKEVVNAYVESGGQLTPFCLDTDWPKAYAAAVSQLEQKK